MLTRIKVLEDFSYQRTETDIPCFYREGDIFYFDSKIEEDLAEVLFFVSKAFKDRKKIHVKC